MQFLISAKEKQTSSLPLLNAHNVIIFGFDSTISDLRIFFRDNKGIVTFYEIPDTSIGFAQDQLEDINEVWFEYSSALQDHLISLIVE